MFVLSGTKRAFGDYRGYGKVIELFFFTAFFLREKESGGKKSAPSAIAGIWRSDIVVRFLPLSSYAKKQAAERKARLRRLQGYGEVI